MRPIDLLFFIFRIQIFSHLFFIGIYLLISIQSYAPMIKSGPLKDRGQNHKNKHQNNKLILNIKIFSHKIFIKMHVLRIFRAITLMGVGAYIFYIFGTFGGVTVSPFSTVDGAINALSEQEKTNIEHTMQSTFPLGLGKFTDAANIFSERDRNNIERTLQLNEKRFMGEFVVVTVPSLEGESIDTYSRQLRWYWKIGSRDKNDGVILLWAVKERQLHIDVGYGLDNILTYDKRLEVILTVMMPYFKKNNFYDGVQAGISSIYSIIETYDGTASILSSFKDEALAGLIVLLMIGCLVYFYISSGIFFYYIIKYGAESGKAKNSWIGKNFYIDDWGYRDK